MSRTTPRDVAPPDLPGYRYIEHLGAGGNAQVYLYEQNLPRRRVAVKVLNESALSEAARRRFTAEANVTADLAHRHIVQVFDANVTPDGRTYIVMPYYPRPNLSVRARRSHFSVADVLRIGIQIGSAVETSHRRGVLHRDIKPQNILTDSYGEPALTDFGIATTQGGDGPEGLSVPWSPPEMLYGTAQGDRRADVYSLGATLWHLLAGRSPFEQPGGDNGTFTLMGRINSEPPPFTQRADVPDSLERLLRQAMAKDPAARPQSAMELIRGLQSIEQELRLPLTHPILPADEPPGDTGGADTIARPGPLGENPFSGGATSHAQSAQQPWGETIPPWDAAKDQRTPGPPAAQARSGYDPAGLPARANHEQAGLPARSDYESAGLSARADEEPTRKRAPMRVDPWGQVDDDRTHARGPVRPGRRGAPGQENAAGFPEFPPGRPEGTAPARPAGPEPGRPEGTVPARPAGPEPGRPEGTTAARRAGPEPGGLAATGRGVHPIGRSSGRVLALSGGVLVAAVAAGAFFTLGRGTGQAQSPPPPPAGRPPAAGGEQYARGTGATARGTGATAPGQPAVTAQRAGVTQVRFSWTYANPAAGDTFRWQRVSGSTGARGGTTAKPRMLLPLPAGRSVCIVVQVRRPGGKPSGRSQPACWPRA